MKRHFRMMAAYNRWANATLYDAAADLTDAEFGHDTGVFFKSMLGTLNHILVADRIWMKRFTAQGEAPKSLDAIIHPNLTPLRLAREAEDARISAWVESLSDTALAGRFTYVTVTDMKTVSQRLAPAMAHFFNHQTHHRGHAHAILSLLGRTPPSLDMIYFQRTEDGREFA
ncbi:MULTISPECIES: DinB family protein [Nitratireductor]|uniref:DinB family protein n=1 Tax=Nitratireductor TaxID=245876 RepID=UPI000D0CC805|nr:MULTISPECIES: DinB family protein [Nitratireductor]PSM17097.1 damage-inducible protein DinB [Nitratireductor sp. StC3]